MTTTNDNPHGKSLRPRLFLRLSALVVGTTLLVSAVFVAFGIQPLVQRINEIQLNKDITRVESALNGVFLRAENVLKMGWQWAAQNPALAEDTETFEQFFIPALDTFPEVASIRLGVVASGGGTLMRRFDGGWRGQRLELRSPEDEARLAARPMDASLQPPPAVSLEDLRQRAWYIAATTQPETIRWTFSDHPAAPGIDGASDTQADEPGIIASMGFTTADGYYAVLCIRLALRELLLALQREQDKSSGENFAAAVLTEEGRLLTLFNASPEITLDDWQNALRHSLTAPPSNKPDFVAGGTGDWISGTRQYLLGEHPVRIVVMRPKVDFVPDWLALLAGLLVTTVLLSAAATTIARRFKPIAPPLGGSGQNTESPLPRHSPVDLQHENGDPVLEHESEKPQQRQEVQESQESSGASSNIHRREIHDMLADPTAPAETHSPRDRDVLQGEAPEPMLYADSGLPLLILDPEKGRILDCNPAAARIHGLASREAATGKTIAELSPPTQYDGTDSEAALRDMLKIALDRGFCTREWRYLRPDGSEWDGEVYLVSFHDGRQSLVQCSIRDVSARADSLRALRQIALHDALTGLVGRAPFIERLLVTLDATHRSGVTDKRIAVFYLDLDRFKEINEAHGHSIGDEVLREVARRFAGTLRDGELLARMGGDEFAILSFVADADAALLVAERVIGSLTRRIEVGTLAFTPGVSIGIALSPGDGDDPETLLRHADIAMYRAKASRRGCLRYAPEMSQGLNENIALARDLKEALRDRPEQFSLRYQPIFDLRSGRLVGAEALMCWTHPVLGPIPSDEFISMAESRGMMDTIGAWVLNRSCRQILIWRGEGRNFTGRLSINVAVQQIENTGFPEQIDRIIRTAGLEPRLFELELTESGMMRNIEQSIDLFTRLNALGFSLSIDDFGTGYSSLAYLKRLPARKLKIDRSFVLDMVNESNDHAIVATIIAMGRTLGMRVVAEGVETQAQADALLALGCDEVQGYYFGYPETAASFAGKWLPMA